MIDGARTPVPGVIMIKAYAVLLAMVVSGVGSLAARVPALPQQPSFHVVSLAQAGSPLKVVPLRVVSDAGPAGIAYRVANNSEKPLSLYQLDVTIFGPTGRARGRYKVTQRTLSLKPAATLTLIASVSKARFEPGSTIIVTTGAVQFDDETWWRTDPLASVDAAHEFMRTKAAPTIAELRPGEVPALSNAALLPSDMDILADVCGYPTGPLFCAAERQSCIALCDPPGDAQVQCVQQFTCNQKECDSDCTCKSQPGCQ
jgi:hypothetical protein